MKIEKIKLTPTATTAKKATMNFMVTLEHNSQNKLMNITIVCGAFILPQKSRSDMTQAGTKFNIQNSSFAQRSFPLKNSKITG